MDLPVNPAFVIAQAVNYLVLLAIIAVAVLVFRDATNHKIPAGRALLWALVSGFTFPIGPLLYVLLGRNNEQQRNPLP